MKVEEVRRRVLAYQPQRSAARRYDFPEQEDILGPEEDMKPAAVLMPIVARPTPTMLLTRRLDTLRSHAGQVAFPGGRIDEHDADVVAAALREAHEEAAIPITQVEVVGLLDDFHTGTGYRITPVVGIIPPDLPLAPAEAEVAALFEVPLAHLLEPANHLVKSGIFYGLKRNFYVIEHQQHYIWGVTASMIVNFAKTLEQMA